MRRTGRILTAVLALLAVLIGLPGPVRAACEACPPRPAAQMSGCHGAQPVQSAVRPACCGGSAEVPALGCCGHFEAAEPDATAPRPAVRFAPAGTARAASTAPAAETARRDAVPVRHSPPEDPPPLHAGVGLFTLHAVFLI